MMTRRPCLGPDRRGGFTLVETLTVLTIMAIMSAIAIPRYASSLARYRADLAARRLAADIALVQASAKAQSAVRGIQINMGGNSYALKDVRNPDGGAGSYTVNLSQAPHLAVISAVSFDRETPDSTLLFDGYGMPDQGLRVTIRSGSFARVVSVDSGTGLASVQ